MAFRHERVDSLTTLLPDDMSFAKAGRCVHRSLLQNKSNLPLYEYDRTDA